jgi:hypothetical protein
LLSYWNQQADNPFAMALNNTRKYVVSTTLTEPLPSRKTRTCRCGLPTAPAAPAAW